MPSTATLFLRRLASSATLLLAPNVSKLKPLGLQDVELVVNELVEYTDSVKGN
jgi:hypothetical protein